METDKQREFLIKSVFYLTVLLFAYIILKLLSGPLLPFAFAVIITVLLQRLVVFVSYRFKIRKKAASVAAVLAVYVLAGCLLSWIGYALYRQLNKLITELPNYAERVSGIIDSISEKINGYVGSLPEGAENFVGKLPSAAADSVVNGLAEYVATLAKNIAAGVPYVILSVVVMIVASAYFAKDYDEICRYLSEKLPKKVTKSLVFIKNDLLSNLSSMLKGYAFIMLMTFVELFIGLTIIGSEYALVIAAVTAVVDILPIFGSGTVLIPWAVLSALFGNVKKSVSIAILYVIITAVRNFIEPKVIGKSLGLHPLVMLASVFIGLKLFGAAGIVILPLFTIVLKNWFEKQSKMPQTE